MIEGGLVFWHNLTSAANSHRARRWQNKRQITEFWFCRSTRMDLVKEWQGKIRVVLAARWMHCSSYITAVQRPEGGSTVSGVYCPETTRWKTSTPAYVGRCVLQPVPGHHCNIAPQTMQLLFICWRIVYCRGDAPASLLISSRPKEYINYS